MTLTPGTRLGPYEITAPLGAGGMGEVYKARDTRLDRTVAIKVLPLDLAADPGVRTRFEREARAISGLDHPNICVLHDVGHQGDVDYLVMQYLDGEPLSARLARGPLPLDEALRYAGEIAAGLDRAHRAGILHRDLKPGNVMLTRSGARETSAKLVDFGLAKLAVTGPHASPNVQATVTSALTDKGTILGTLLYMSPEQLEGRELDARSDIFSFGAVLYEMVTGARAFDGGSQASIIAAILQTEPPPMATRTPLTPPALERVVHKCLAKDPERRWQSAADLRDEIVWIAQPSGALSQPSGLASRSSRRLPRAAVAAGLLMLALAAALAWALTRTPARGTPAGWHLGIALAEGTTLAPGGVAVSPDGKTIVYTASPSKGGATHRPSVAATTGRLYMRRFNAVEPTALPGTEGGRAPFFSPDGLSIGFFTDVALMRISLLGGPPVRLVGVPPVSRGGAWMENDIIILSPTHTTTLFRLSPGAAAAEPVTTLDVAQGEKGHVWPSPLPGGTHVLFTIRRGTSDHEDGDIAVADVSSGERAIVVEGATHGRYSATGHLLFVRGGNLMAAPFDLRTRKTRGTPLPVVDKVSTDAWIGGAHYAVGPGGNLIFMSGTFGDVRTSAVWVDRSGKLVPTPALSEGQPGKPRISPDGKRAVFDGVSADGDMEIYLADLVRGTTVRFSADPQDDFNPVWTADGTRVIWTALPPGRIPFLVWKSADGTGVAEEIVKHPDEAQFAGSVSPDGLLAYSQTKGLRLCDVWIVPLKGERKAQRFIQGAAQEYGPEFSPDGRWLAYVSDEAGALDVYVVPYPGPGGKLRVTSGGAVAPVWSRDGKELFYQTSAGLMAVSVSGGRDPQFGAPTLLFDGDFVRYSREDRPREYDVAPGGNRFLMMKAERKEGGATPTLDIMFDWPSEMAARASRR